MAIRKIYKEWVHRDLRNIAKPLLRGGGQEIRKAQLNYLWKKQNELDLELFRLRGQKHLIPPAKKAEYLKKFSSTIEYRDYIVDLIIKYEGHKRSL